MQAPPLITIVRGQLVRDTDWITQVNQQMGALMLHRTTAQGSMEEMSAVPRQTRIIPPGASDGQVRFLTQVNGVSNWELPSVAVGRGVLDGSNITVNSIDEDKLRIANSPANGQVLRYRGGHMFWENFLSAVALFSVNTGTTGLSGTGGTYAQPTADFTGYDAYVLTGDVTSGRVISQILLKSLMRETSNPTALSGSVLFSNYASVSMRIEATQIILTIRTDSGSTGIDDGSYRSESNTRMVPSMNLTMYGLSY